MYWWQCLGQFLERRVSTQRELSRRWVDEECMLEKMVWTKCKLNASTLVVGACLRELDAHDMCIKDKTIFINAKRSHWINSHLERLMSEQQQRQQQR